MTNWGLGPGGTGATALSATGVSLLGGGVLPAEKLTLVRTRGVLDLFLNTAASANDGFFGAMGIGIASDAAFDAGIVSLPTPLSESIWDGWLYHTFFSVHASINSGGTASHQRVEVDSKAMRITSEENVIYAAIEVVEIGVATMDVFFESRMLFKLA